MTCVVCHDPHGSSNEHQLRFAADSRDIESNLCAKCHQRRSVPDWAGSSDSPHAPHGPLVLGEAGWFPEGVSFEAPMSTHGSEANPGLCKTCHLTNYSVTDAATGAFQVTVTGHRFIAIPCVDANGAPTDDQSCTVTGRSFKGCASATCHGNSEANARSAFTAANSDVLGLAALLDQMVAQVPSNQFGAGKTTAGRGAKFNSALAKGAGAAVHNPFLVKALLRYSGVALNQAYGIAIPPGLAPTAADLKYLRISR